jgi:Fe-S-cluster-containing hydrogenase component 2
MVDVMNLIKPRNQLLSPAQQSPPVPLASLQAGHWFKLICGASYQHIPTIRSLAIAYALAGADCIDIAADPAIVATLQEALTQVQQLAPLASAKGFSPNPNPWLMVSLNDGEDPHFRKAEFDPQQCPQDCPRPCERICPAQAISLDSAHPSGVIDALCYGCGRCLPICPIGQIRTRSYVYRPEMVAPMVLQSGVDAVEIHTQIGRLPDFKRLWQAIAPWTPQLKLIAISCPDGEDLIDYLWAIYEQIAPSSLPLACALVWQTDGRPMSGDIGDGATRACIKLGQKVLKAGLPGFVQLAGGTNAHTVIKARSIGLLSEPGQPIAPRLAGIAYGSYARAALQPLLNQLETMTDLHDSHSDGLRSPPSHPHNPIEDHPDILWAAVAQAHQLVAPLKTGA